MNFIKNSWKAFFKKQGAQQKSETKQEKNNNQKPSQNSPQDEIPYQILQQLFKLSSQLIKQSKNVTDNSMKLKIYGLYKQATIGDNNTKCPQMFDMVGKSKWNAWEQLKGMKKTMAMTHYIKLVSELDPKISKKIEEKLCQGEQVQKQIKDQKQAKAKPTQGIGHKKVQVIDHSDEYTHPYFKHIEKGQQLQNIELQQLLLKDNVKQIYPLHFAIDRERVDLVQKFIDILPQQEILKMKDSEGTGILEYAQLIQNQQILQLVKNKLKKQ